MKIKCIAIGNRIMGDDGIGIRVVEELSEKLEKKNIEVIISETDVDYALSKIEEGDFLLIVDSTYLGLKPGTVTFSPITDANRHYRKPLTQHQPNLIYYLMTNRTKFEGYVIGIEVEDISFSLHLSDKLNQRLPGICRKVMDYIDHLLGGINHA